MSKQTKLKQRILDRITMVPESGCWLWTGCWSKAGYGMISVDGQPLYTHRLMWELHYGPIPDKAHVCHKCDTPACCNPGHLFLGTASDNAMDATNKGRMGRGEANGNMRYSRDFVRAVFAFPGTGTEAAAHFGIHSGHVSLIRSRKTRAADTADL